MQDADTAIVDGLDSQRGGAPDRTEARAGWLGRAILAAGEGWAVVDDVGGLRDVAGPFLDLLGAAGREGAGLREALRGMRADDTPRWPPVQPDAAWRWRGERQDGRMLELDGWPIAEGQWAIRVRPAVAAAPAPKAATALYHPDTRMPQRPLLMDRLQQAIDRSCRTVTQRFALILIGLHAVRDCPDGRAGPDAAHVAADCALQRAIARQLESAVRPADTIAHLDDSVLAVIIEPIRGDESMVRSAVSAFVDGMRRALNDVPAALPVGARATFAVALGDGSSHPSDLITKARQRLASRVAEPPAAPRPPAADSSRARAHAAISLDVEFRLDDNTPQAIAVCCETCPDAGTLLSALLAASNDVAWPDDMRPELIIATGRLPSMEAVQALQRAQGLWRSDSRLVLEPEEAAIARDPEGALFLADAAARRGVRLGIGRFGLDLSPEGLLQRLPLTRIAIDPDLIADAVHAGSSRTRLAEAITWARARQLRIVAAGVVDRSAVDSLAALGCDAARGPAFRSGPR